MNNNKFCFIICTNNDIYLEEAVHYINHLTVPSEYEVEFLTISDAPSMTQGYNRAMVSSDARYKIYMHQDTFILNRNLLSDLLAIFLSDSQIGMVGMVGYDTVSPEGIMWQNKRIGNCYPGSRPTPYPEYSGYHYSITEDGYSFVALVDGFFIATSQDLPWNTELLTSWHFYDAFQSIQFLLHGYKIAVPTQSSPWCLHDDLFLDLMDYDHYRQIFMRTYHDFLGKHYTEILSKADKGEQD